MSETTRRVTVQRRGYWLSSRTTDERYGWYPGRSPRDSAEAWARARGYDDLGHLARETGRSRASTYDDLAFLHETRGVEVELTHWTRVDLAVACGRGEYDVPRGDNPERRELMAEYRDTGAIEGAFLADLDTLNRAARRGDEGADLGPGVDEIDWTGIDD